MMMALAIILGTYTWRQAKAKLLMLDAISSENTVFWLRDYKLTLILLQGEKIVSD